MKGNSAAGDAGIELSVYVCREESLTAALAFGADAVIIDTPRTRSTGDSEFDLKSLEAAHNRARKLGKKITVWFPAIPKTRHLAEAASVAASIARIGIDSAIVRDPFVIATLSGLGLKHFILDPEIPVANPASASFWQAQGLCRWFPPFDSTLQDLKETLQISGGRGFCSICLCATDAKGNPLYSKTGDAHHCFAPLETIPQFLEAGCRNFYLFPPSASQIPVAISTRAVRNCIDNSVFAEPSPRKMRGYIRDLKSVCSLPISKGFLPGYLHKPKEAKNQGSRLGYRIAGVVREFFADQGRARVLLQHPIKVNDELIAITPDGDYRTIIGAASMMNDDGHAVEYAAPPQYTEISIFLPKKTTPYSLLAISTG